MGLVTSIDLEELGIRGLVYKKIQIALSTRVHVWDSQRDVMVIYKIPDGNIDSSGYRLATLACLRPDVERLDLTI
jgi:hypothetical protein